MNPLLLETPGCESPAAALGPAPPPCCSLNPLCVGTATPMNVVLRLLLALSTPVPGHTSALCWSGPVRPIRRTAAVSLPAPPPTRNCRTTKAKTTATPVTTTGAGQHHKHQRQQQTTETGTRVIILQSQQQGAINDNSDNSNERSNSKNIALCAGSLYKTSLNNKRRKQPTTTTERLR